MTSFKTLQREWYSRLRAEGFNDIEKNSLPEPSLRRWDSQWFKFFYSGDYIQEKQDYYYYGFQFLHAHTFKNHVEHRIWQLHIEGQSCRDISCLLEKEGVKFNKDKVNSVVRTLRSNMLPSHKEEDHD